MVGSLVISPPPGSRRGHRARGGADHSIKPRPFSPRTKRSLRLAEKAEFPITKLCQYLQVSPSGFYAARGRPESTHAQTDRRLRVLVRASFEASRQRYGSPRIHEDARPESALGRRHDGVRHRRQRQALSRGRPGSILAVRRGLGAVNDRHVTIKALDMALKRRCPDAGLLHHSDQGCTYASEDYQAVLDANGITCSMSRRGNCYDNAVMESFFSSVKSEVADRFDSCGEAKMELFDYIEVFYNQRRRHSTLGQISPAAFERRATHAA